VKIRGARNSDCDELAEMRGLLWPEASKEELRQEIDAWLRGEGGGTLPATALIAEDESDGLAGFIEVGLRSHADGCDVAQPVGYVEGWFVRQELRARGIGKELMRAAEDWARRQGCQEMASDALIDNRGSQNAHAALGFEVVDRCVHYRKGL
jgi:aminoglycoside 6'-N-acetyltransferase I